jgi:hypothetical protein
MRRLALCLAMAAAMSVWAQDEGDPGKKKEGDAPAAEPEEKKDDAPAGDPEALKAIQDGAAKAMEKKHTYTGAMEVLVGGAPMFSSEVRGRRVAPYTHLSMEMMGQVIETWTNGTDTVSKNSQTGEWEKAGGGGGGGGRGRGRGMRSSISVESLVKLVKSATFGDDAKVGSHECRIVKAHVDPDDLKKVLPGGGRGGQGATVSKSSLRFYIDKDDGRLRRLKLSAEAAVNMQGMAQDIEVAMDYRYKFSSKIELAMPGEVKALFEPTDEKPGEDETEKEPEGKEAEGSGR